MANFTAKIGNKSAVIGNMFLNIHCQKNWCFYTKKNAGVKAFMKLTPGPGPGVSFCRFKYIYQIFLSKKFLCQSKLFKLAFKMMKFFSWGLFDQATKMTSLMSSSFRRLLSKTNLSLTGFNTSLVLY